MEHLLEIAPLEKVMYLQNDRIYELISQGKFPKQIKLSVRSSGWLESEIDEWIAARVSERD